MERQLFNSSVSDRFTLHLNNSLTEHSLEDTHQSSAHNFEALVEPPLDLGNLIYLRSKEAEVRLENLHISSLPLTFFECAEEVIKTRLYIDPALVRDNFVLIESVLEEENDNQLQISVNDFHTHLPSKALDYMNSLLDNSANIYVIKRYMEIVADDDSIFIDTIFDNLSADQSVDQDIRVHDLALLARYCDFSIFARLQLAKHLYELINPKGNIKNILNTKYKYKGGFLTRLKEERQLNASKILNSPDRRLNFNESLNTTASPLKLIDLTGFYDIRLDKLNTPEKDDNKPKTLPPDLKTRSEKIKSVLITWLKMTNKMESDNHITGPNKTYIEQWFYNNVSLIKIGRKLSELIYNAIEKLKRPNSTIFSRQFLQLSLDRSQLKVKFHINKQNLVEKTSLKVTFPPYVSYKLGSSLPTDSYNHMKLTKIKVGPISLAENQVASLFTNVITSEKQKTFSSIRFLPQLLCVKSSILAECGR